jgi:hypothetical protein
MLALQRSGSDRIVLTLKNGVVPQPLVYWSLIPECDLDYVPQKAA